MSVRGFCTCLQEFWSAYIEPIAPNLSRVLSPFTPTGGKLFKSVKSEDKRQTFMDILENRDKMIDKK